MSKIKHCPDCGRQHDARAKKCRWCHDQKPITERCCTRCRVTKPISEFRIRTRVNPKPRSVCRVCESDRAKNRPLEVRRAIKQRSREKDPEHYRARGRRARIKRKWGEASVLRLSEPSACDCCGRVTELVVDHCHTRGHIRGYLCPPCNLGLGHFKDDPERLRAAIQYLRRDRKKNP